MSWQQWATFGGQLGIVYYLLSKFLIGFSRLVAVRAAGLHHLDQVAAASLS